MLVDASSLIYRAYFSNPDTIRATPERGGIKVNAAHGFLSMLARLVSDHDPEWLACCTDEDWRPQWRVELIETYKTHRVAADPTGESGSVWGDEDLELQAPVIFEILEACGVAAVGCAGYEAEDVIGALAERAPGPVKIVSGDRDLFQLVQDPKIKVLYPRRGVSDVLVVDEAEISTRFGIPGRAYGDYALLRGDPSDGLPGVRGIGEKTAAALLTRFGSLEAIIEAAVTDPAAAQGPLGKVRASIDYLDKAARVALISSDIPLEDRDIARPRLKGQKKVDRDRAKGLASDYGLTGPVKRLIDALGEVRRES